MTRQRESGEGLDDSRAAAPPRRRAGDLPLLTISLPLTAWRTVSEWTRCVATTTTMRMRRLTRQMNKEELSAAEPPEFHQTKYQDFSRYL